MARLAAASDMTPLLAARIKTRSRALFGRVYDDGQGGAFPGIEAAPQAGLLQPARDGVVRGQNRRETRRAPLRDCRQKARGADRATEFRALKIAAQVQGPDGLAKFGGQGAFVTRLQQARYLHGESGRSRDDAPVEGQLFEQPASWPEYRHPLMAVKTLVLIVQQ